MATMELASIPRELPQFGRHLSSLARPASEVFGQQGARRGKGSCGCGGGKGSCACSTSEGCCGCSGGHTNNLQKVPACPPQDPPAGGGGIPEVTNEFCYVNGVKVFGKLFNAGWILPRDGGPALKCDTTYASPLECGGECNLYIYTSQSEIPLPHRKIVERAILQRFNVNPEWEWSHFGLSDGSGQLVPVVGRRGGVSWRRWTAGRLREAIPTEGHVFVAVLQYSCGCDPSAQLDWFKRASPRTDPYLQPWSWDPRGDETFGRIPSYREYIDAIQVCEKPANPNEKGPCLVAGADTPTGDFGEHQYAVVGTVRWKKGKTKECKKASMVTLRVNQTIPWYDPVGRQGDHPSSVRRAEAQGRGGLGVIYARHVEDGNRSEIEPSVVPIHDPDLFYRINGFEHRESFSPCN